MSPLASGTAMSSSPILKNAIRCRTLSSGKVADSPTAQLLHLRELSSGRGNSHPQTSSEIPRLFMSTPLATRRPYLRRHREKQDPEEVRVVGFEHHDRYKYQHQHRRKQDGVGQCQPLPGHVHEDGDDQAGLQHHEQHDQGPPEIAMDAKVVDHIGAGAEDEQPTPDHEIELDRVLLASCVRGCWSEHMSLQQML